MRPEDVGLGESFWIIHEAVVVADATSGRIVLWNPAAEALFGYSAADATALTVQALVPESVGPIVRRRLARFAGKYAPPRRRARRPYEVPVVRSDGTLRDVELTLYPVQADSDAQRYVLAFLRDVTVRKRLEQERLVRERLHGALLAVRTLDHELRNQLALTVGYTELVLRDPALPPHLRERATEALEGAREAVAILGQLERMSQLQEQAWGERLGATIKVSRSRPGDGGAAQALPLSA